MLLCFAPVCSALHRPNVPRALYRQHTTETTTAAVALLSELRQQYVIAIEAVAAREWRRLDVRVKRPSAVVRARNGYYGG